MSERDKFFSDIKANIEKAHDVLSHNRVFLGRETL